MAKPKKGITDLIMDDLKKSLSDDSSFERTQIHSDVETKFLSVAPKKKIKDEDFAKLMLGSDAADKDLSRVVPQGATHFGLAQETPEGLSGDTQNSAQELNSNSSASEDESLFQLSDQSSSGERSHDSSEDQNDRATEMATEMATQVATDEFIAEVGPASEFFKAPKIPTKKPQQQEEEPSLIFDPSENTMAHDGDQGESVHTEVKVGHSGRSNASREPWLQSNFHQAESLRIAQERVAALEKEVHELRKENQLLVTAAEFSQQKVEELNEKIFEVERSKNQALDQAQLEMNVYRENLFQRDKDLERAKMKHEELDSKFRRDLNRVRVRERELENRLELSRAEKTALLTAKDQRIIELKKKQDQMNQELESLKMKLSELQSRSQFQNEQIQRTIKTLRLALTHLETQSGPSTVAPLKKVD